MTTFVKFTLGDIRASVRRKLDDLGFDTSTIDEAANDFQFELFNNNRIRFMEKAGVLAFSTNDVTKPMPADFQTLINLTVFDTASTPRDITKSLMDYDTFMRSYPNYTTALAQKIYNYTFFGEDIRLSARSNGNYTVNIDYLRSPLLMVAASDTCELPINFREMMTLGTLERVMRVNEDYNESDEEVRRLQSLRNSFVKVYGRGGIKVGPQVIKSNRMGSIRSGRAYRQGEDM